MILVTGGAGFIGSNLVAALCERQAGPIYVCDLPDTSEKTRNLAKHPIAGTVEPDALDAWLDSNGDGLDVVFHMGASSSTVVTDPNFVLANNFDLSLKLWRWCANQNVRLIYASSAATYGDGTAGFDDDDSVEALSRLRPLNLYGWSKHLFDINAVTLASAGVAPPQWAGLKFFNVYGPNEYHKGGQESLVVQLYRQIREAGRARLFRSHNPDYADGGQERDFIWVGDCVNIMLWLYDNPQIDGIYNAGTGKARTFADLARACFDATSQQAQIDYFDTPENIRRHYQYHTQATMTRLRNAGYDKPPTALEEGVRRYIQDYLATNDPYR
ncbi:MAG: ADP-glyceromanno-heptose 6-epimerase [Alphaproteobacteria bacterium]|nr:ADP-glyceromanno-heptose 6-epimerase [Alphaproteobacteria bacterium]